MIALATDLMDRSRLSATIDGISFAANAEECSDGDAPDVVIVDLARFAPAIAELRRAFPDARIAAFGPHVDEDAARGARADGADLVWPRSRFFRDPAAATREIEDPDS